MNKNDAKKQIDQMVGFIMKEAEERAADLKRDTENEVNARRLEKERIFTTQLREEYARKKKERLVQQRILRSQKKNECRVKVMRERDGIIREVKEEVISRLSSVATNAKYPELLRYLIAQGLMIITENRVILQCRQEDEKVIRAQVQSAVKLYQDFITEQTAVTPKCALEISSDYLPPGPRAGRKGLSCCGGMVLSSRQGQIVCRNTLDSRLDLCFENLIPQVRALLWGVRARPRRDAPPAAAGHGH